MNINQNNTFGDNNINFGAPQRRVDTNLKDQLKHMLNRGERVKVSAALGDSEAIIFAEEIFNFLKESGYETEEGINQCIWMPALRGQSISPGLEKGFRLINIGNQ